MSIMKPRRRPSEFLRQLNTQIAMIIEERGCSQEWLAQRLGVSRQAVNIQLNNPEVNWNIGNLKGYLDVLGYEIKIVPKAK